VDLDGELVQRVVERVGPGRQADQVQLAAAQPPGLVRRDVARQDPGRVDLHAVGQYDRQAVLPLGHLGQAGQGAADLEQRPAQGGQRVVRGREQQRRQVVPCRLVLQAEVGEQSPGLAAGQRHRTAPAFDPGSAEQRDPAIHDRGDSGLTGHAGELVHLGGGAAGALGGVGSPPRA
jgi:hypothetical protein